MPRLESKPPTARRGRVRKEMFAPNPSRALAGSSSTRPSPRSSRDNDVAIRSLTHAGGSASQRAAIRPAIAATSGGASAQRAASRSSQSGAGTASSSRYATTSAHPGSSRARLRAAESPVGAATARAPRTAAASAWARCASSSRPLVTSSALAPGISAAWRAAGSSAGRTSAGARLVQIAARMRKSATLFALLAAPGEDPLAALPPRTGRRSPAVRSLGHAIDALLDGRQRLRGTDRALDRLAADWAPRRVAVLGVYGDESSETMAAAIAELRRSRQDVVVALGALAEGASDLAESTRQVHMGGGRLANFNRLVALGERFGLHLVQPALSRSSHTAWPMVRRRPALLRRTSFVEIGPALMIRREAFAQLSPFPEDGMGWGVDLHWAAVAERNGWKLGVADAVPIRHDLRAPAVDYDREAARDAARRLLRVREHIGWREAVTVEAFRSL